MTGVFEFFIENNLISKNQLIQYNTVLAITRALRSSSRENVYQELGLESVQQRWWFRKLCYFVQITKNKSPKYLFDKIATTRNAYRTGKNIDNIP